MFKKKKKEIKVIDGVIPYDEIKDHKDITFIVISVDEKVITKSIKAIANVYEQYKDRNFNVVISSSYEKLHRLSRGVF